MNINPFFDKEGEVAFLDQRKLPFEENYFMCRTLEDCHNAISNMVVRGAPLIGLTAMWGLALWLRNHPRGKWEEWEGACRHLATARPTAVNLFYAIEKCQKIVHHYFNQQKSFSGLYGEMINFIKKEVAENRQNCQNIATSGAGELARLYGGKPLHLMTLCNTGVLACGSLGTALGIISHLHSLGRVEMVYVSETRPWLQGSRLTSYELLKQNIPHKIIVDSASSWLMREKRLDAIFVGADRVAANGDTANKIGTSSLAIAARYYQVPFYVAAPVSSFDISLESGDDISIEMRDEEEILCCSSVPISPEGAGALNPGFDITKGNLITALFCEKGMISPLNKETISLKIKSMSR